MTTNVSGYVVSDNVLNISGCWMFILSPLGDYDATHCECYVINLKQYAYVTVPEQETRNKFILLPKWLHWNTW